jgi:hypothetical protein
MADDHGRSNRRNDGNRNVIQSIAAEENDIIMIRELPSSEAENLDEDEFIPVNAPRPRSRKQPAAGKASKTVTKRGRKPASPAVEEDIVLVSDSDEDKPKVAPSRRGKRTVQVDTDGDDTTGDYSETEDLTSAAKTSASSNARQSSRRKAANNDAAAPPKKRQTSIIAAFKQNQDIQQQSSSSSHSKTATPASKWPSRRR